MRTFRDLKIGILGGGQLGKMLCAASNPYHLDVEVLDPSVVCPASINAPNLTLGDYTAYEDVLAFGRTKDLITIEIENVNVDALRVLEAEGIQVHGRPQSIAIIQDKGLQKRFFQDHDLATLPYVLAGSKQELLELLANGNIAYPFVQKIRKGGFDGRGVLLVQSAKDLDRAFDAPSVIETKIDIAAEVSVIGCTNGTGAHTTFPPVQMVFDESSNALDYLTTIVQVSDRVLQQIEDLSQKTIQAFGIQGLLAMEFLVDNQDQVYLNEVAPRPHNSGHHTLHATSLSQFDLHWRGVLGLPIPSPVMSKPAALLNVVGPPKGSGAYRASGLEDIMSIAGVYPYFYGKKESRPNRKLGHLTILGDSLSELEEKIIQCKRQLSIEII